MVPDEGLRLGLGVEQDLAILDAALLIVGLVRMPIDTKRVPPHEVEKAMV